MFYDADLHIHSPHSMAVSKNLNLDTMVDTCRKKGLSILSTGDITQPDWRKYLLSKLEKKNSVYSYKDVNFIIGTELEDDESVHELVLLPDINAGEELQQKLSPLCKDITAQWAGRPHVHSSPAEIVEIVDSVGGVVGPAHAFTPFKAIFRAGKFKNLEECYGSTAKKVLFLELGLSADTYIADRMKCLENITFTSNSDAHSEGPQSLGREFNRFEIEEPSFEEIVKAFKRQNGRKITLNVGLEPRLGKYPLIFCKDCRYRVQVFLNSQVPKEIQGLTRINTLTDSFAIDDQFVYYFFDNELQINNFKQKIIDGKILCEGCKKLNKKSKLVLGVFDRIGQIADYKEPKHPPHRPPYLDIVPLVEMLRVLYKVKSVNAKTVINEYEKLIKKYGSEFKILTDDDILPQLKREGYQNLADLIAAFKNKSITFIPGGGGIYGEISFENME